ncbi:alpha-(1-_3)-arabinofuranosyltransferase domain-containing protein [Actinokineospora sp. NPDC004072]
MSFARAARHAAPRPPLRRRPDAAVMAGLVLLSLLQLPGRTTFDTKLDLTEDPLGFLGRALHLWNPATNSGELQNQAYGYLFPMGPYFALCDLLGLPGWLAQQLWVALLLCLSFAGALAVARRLRIGSEPARIIGALAYALAPRMVTEVGLRSAEVLSAVALPWILLPLIRPTNPRRAAALSGCAVLAIGGINGAVVVMALVLPGLWLATRRWSADHARLVGWWVVAVAAAVLWWFLPLALLGRYGLPFVDYVESAANTTTPTSLFQVLRGTNQWVAYLVRGEPEWPTGFLLVDHPALMAATGLLAALALAGLARARLPERAFLAIGVVTGTALMAVGFVGALDSPLAEPVRALLDGPLAPLRNVHKFEPGLRLPMALALAHALAGRLPGVPALTARWLRPAAGALLVLVVTAPAGLLMLRPGPGWSAIPAHWQQALAWLADADATGRTLIVPGTGFAEYTWGSPVDEPAQPLARAPWSLRSQLPLSSEGHIRVLDAVEDALATGRGTPGLAEFLARSGHRFVLLRTDVEPGETPPVEAVRAALERSPGLSRVAVFGALEVYAVAEPPALARAVVDAATVSGGPESLLPLLGAGLIHPGTPAVLAGDGGAPAGPRLVTDGLRRQERNVGRMRDGMSATLARDEPARLDRPALDLLPFPGVEHQTTAAYRGVLGVSASSSAGYADSPRPVDPSGMPFAAVDGDPYTSWQSSTLDSPVGQWLEVRLDTPRVVEHVELRMVDDRRVGWPVTRVRLDTDAGSVEHEVAPGGGPQVLPVSAGLTGRVRVSVVALAAGRTTGHVGIAELAVPGVSPSRALRVPGDRGTAYAFSRGSQARYACLRVDGAFRCDTGRARHGEEPSGVHRLFDSDAGVFTAGGTVLPAAGATPPIELPGAAVSASSHLAGDPAAAALGAVDGDPATSWIADPTDPRPALRVTWDRPTRVGTLRLRTAEGVGAGRPTEVDVTTSAGTRRLSVGDGGAIAVAATTDRLEIAVVRVADHGLPAGITALDGLPIAPVAAGTPFTVGCGDGPTVRIDGAEYATSVSGTVDDLRDHRPLPLRLCPDGRVELAAGGHELRTGRTSAFVVQDFWLRSAEPVAPRTRAVEVLSWSAADRQVRVAAGPGALLVVPENANAGWVAEVDGAELARTRVDGWQQAWVLPESGAVTVRLRFEPDTAYRARLLGGAGAALALVALAAVPGRRRPAFAQPSTSPWLGVALVVPLLAVGGALGLIILLACLLLRALFGTRRRAVAMALAAGGMAVATAAAVAGRLLGHGQDWAYGPIAQAGGLVALAAVVTACLRWFDGDAPR